MKKFFTLIVCGFYAMSSLAQENADVLFNRAIELHENNELDDAIALYQELEELGYASSSLYQNLGILYLQKKEDGQAVISFERCLKVDTRAMICARNLALLRNRIDSYKTPFRSISIIHQIDFIVRLIPSVAWAILSLLFLFLTIGWFMRYSNAGKIYPIFVFASLLAISISMGARMKYLQTNRDYAIVISPGVDLFRGPDNDSQILYQIQEGSKVKVLTFEGDWIQVRLINRDIAWVKNHTIEVI